MSTFAGFKGGAIHAPTLHLNSDIEISGDDLGAGVAFTYGNKRVTVQELVERIEQLERALMEMSLLGKTDYEPNKG